MVPTSEYLIPVAATAEDMGVNLMVEQYNSSIKDAWIENFINPTVRRGQINCYCAMKRLPCPRKSWARLKQSMTDRQFRYYFRMPKDMYEQLCSHIEDIDGAEEFKSEYYLNNILTTMPRVG